MTGATERRSTTATANGAFASNEPLGWHEIGVVVFVSLLFTVWLLLWDRMGLMQGGPIPYGNSIGCDVWRYFGLSILPKAGLVLAPGTRVIARPMYFGPLYGLHSLLPFVGITVLSYLLNLNVTLVSLYVALRALYARATVLFACLLVGLCPLLLNESSTTYVTVASLGYTCCMLACLTWASRVRRARPLASDMLYGLAGLFFVWAANASLMAIKFNFLFCLFALSGALSRPIEPWRVLASAIRPACFFLAGLLAGGAAVFLLSKALGLGWEAPLYQVRDAWEGLQDFRYPGWVWETVSFGLLALIAVFCGIALLRARGASAGAIERVYLPVGIVVASCLFHLHSAFVVGDQNLLFDWFYVLLLPILAIAFCAAFDRLIERMTARDKTTMFAVTAVGILAYNALVAVRFEIKAWLYNNTTLSMAIAFLILLGALAVGRLRGFGATLVALMAVALTLQTATGSHMRQHFFASRASEKGYTDLAQAALTFVAPFLGHYPVIWLASADDGRLHLSIMRALQRCVNYTPSFPEAPPKPEGDQPPLEAGRTLIVVDGQGRSPSEIDAALRPFGYRLELAAQRSIAADPPRSVMITVGTVRTLH